MPQMWKTGSPRVRSTTDSALRLWLAHRSCEVALLTLWLWDDGIRRRAIDGDRLKIEARRAEARQFEDAKCALPKPPIRCRSCRKTDREVAAMVEMGGHIFCDECIELAASIIAVRKAEGR
jgi:ClpX C4-type zinc finger protein